MEEIKFRVQGSAPEPYNVRFIRSGKNLTALCTCPAGSVGQYCKHRIRILEGSAEDIVSGNESAVETIVAWLPGTDVENAINAVRDGERRLEALKSELSAMKKKLARTLSD